MSRNWIEFTDPSPIGREELYASLNSRGQMCLGKKTCEALGSPDQVVLLFEPDTDCIGVRAAPPLASNAISLHRQDSSGARRLFSARFMRKHKIRLNGTVRFPSAHIEDETLVLDLHTRLPATIERGKNK